MNSVYKIISFIVIAFILAYSCLKLDSSFSNKFADNILSLLTTLFAINIASSTLIASKIREIQDRTGHHFEKSKGNLRTSFNEQLVLIGVAFLATLIRESAVVQNAVGINLTCLTCDTILFACFIYYIDIIKDIGAALFQLLDFDNNKGSK